MKRMLVLKQPVAVLRLTNEENCAVQEAFVETRIGFAYTCDDELVLVRLYGRDRLALSIEKEGGKFFVLVEDVCPGISPTLARWVHFSGYKRNGFDTKTQINAAASLAFIRLEIEDALKRYLKTYLKQVVA